MQHRDVCCAPPAARGADVPVVGVITPEAHAAVQATRNRRIGLLATEGTVAAGRYAELVRALDAGVELVSVACPGLVPLIESEDPFGAKTRRWCARTRRRSRKRRSTR